MFFGIYFGKYLFMTQKSWNKNLHKANKAKNDEFYTQLSDIEKELRYYKNHFRDKVVYCNCDDPFESNFFKYFASNFNALKLKKLIATSFVNSPVAGKQLDLLEIEGLKPDGKQPFRVDINEVKSSKKNWAIDMGDVEYLLRHSKNTATPLQEDGDFRSSECIEILKEVDIVVTNPPFSLFREYVTQLFEYNKKFIIVGNQNAITYKEIFKFIQDDRLWLGYGFNGGAAHFINKHYEDYATAGNHKEWMIRVSGVTWFTNIEIQKRHEDLILYKTYKGNEKEYPKYDNYDAINVDKTKNIPVDYSGVIWVPITFLDKYNPEQFEIIKFRKGDDEKDLCINGKCPYFRILIKNKKL